MIVGVLDREDLTALNLYLIRGYNFRQVEEETGVSRQRLRAMLDRDDVKDIMKEAKAAFQIELDSMHELVTNDLKELLSHPKPEVRLAAIDRWARMNGRYKDNLNIGKEVSAEDVAKELMHPKEAEAVDG